MIKLSNFKSGDKIRALEPIYKTNDNIREHTKAVFSGETKLSLKNNTACIKAVKVIITRIGKYGKIRIAPTVVMTPILLTKSNKKFLNIIAEELKKNETSKIPKMLSEKENNGISENLLYIPKEDFLAWALAKIWYNYETSYLAVTKDIWKGSEMLIDYTNMAFSTEELDLKYIEHLTDVDVRIFIVENIRLLEAMNAKKRVYLRNKKIEMERIFINKYIANMVPVIDYKKLKEIFNIG